MPILSLSTQSLFLEMDYFQALKFAAEHGFQGVEIWSNVFDFWPGKASAGEIEAIRAVARESHLSLALHFCPGNDLADLNRGHLEESRRQLRETIDLGAKIGAGLVVVHPGKVHRMSVHNRDPLARYPRFTLDRLRREAVLRFRESLMDALPCALESRVVIGVENFSHTKDCLQTRFEDLPAWVDEIASPFLQVTLDVGHANIEGGVERAIEVLGPRIRHVHLNDNDGRNSDHGELGTGTVDWPGIAPFLRSFGGMLSLEIPDFRDPRGAVLRSKAFLEKLLEGGNTRKA